MNASTLYSHRPNGAKWDILTPTDEVICQASSEKDAKALVTHLNYPLPGSREAEYLVSSEGFWMAGMKEEEKSAETLTDPKGNPVATFESDDEGWALLEHLNRPMN